MRSTGIWKTVAMALFGILQALSLGILLHIVNRLDKMDDKFVVFGERVTRIEAKQYMLHPNTGP